MLRFVTGAPGAGKTTLLPHLVARPGILAAEFDDLLDGDGAVLGSVIAAPTAAPLWPAYSRLWVRVVRLLLRSELPVVVLCPLTPAEWRDAAGESLGRIEVGWALLDCADADRRTRLAGRGWDAARIDDAVADAAELRAAVPTRFSSTGRTPADLAADVASWSTGTG